MAFRTGIAALVASAWVAWAHYVPSLEARHGDDSMSHDEDVLPMPKMNLSIAGPPVPPPFCTVNTTKELHGAKASCIALDAVDAIVPADKAGWALRPAPKRRSQAAHGHAHGTEKVMEVLNETRLFSRKGAVPLSYIEWDWGAGLGRLSELRRFTSEEADKIQAMWPKRQVIGRSGQYWRALSDSNYPKQWDRVRKDIRYRLGKDAAEEPSRQIGLAAFVAMLFGVACFIQLPVLLCLQAARSTLVPLMSLVYLVTFTTSLIFGRIYFALAPELYPPSALGGLVRTLMVLSYALFGFDCLKLLFLVVPLVRGRMRSWADVQHIMRVLAQGQENVGLRSRSGNHPLRSHLATSAEQTLTGSPDADANEDGEMPENHEFVVFDQDKQPAKPLLDSSSRMGFAEPTPDENHLARLRRPWEEFAHNHPRTAFTLGMLYTTLSRGLVPLAFTVVYVSIAVYTGSCRRLFKNVCLAHGIKGGIFFWYGILTFVRFLGAFGEYGWAWNKRPTPENSQHSPAAFWRRNMPSGEFIECFVIFLYGISNTWLERLGAQRGDPYTVKQIQHISIAVMFWFVGLVGMGLESTRVRQLLSRPIVGAHPAAAVPNPGQDAVLAQVQPPSYISSFNPFPALVIGATGVAMAAHHQDYEYEVKVHVLWGIMLAAFAVLRCFTYFFLWLRPPTSVIPSRPPTEALASFTLCCGGLLFMLSNEEVSFAAMRADYADPMAVLNFAISVVGLVLCWSFCIMLIKAWALKRETRNFANTSEPWAQEQHFVISEPYEAA